MESLWKAYTVLLALVCVAIFTIVTTRNKRQILARSRLKRIQEPFVDSKASASASGITRAIQEVRQKDHDELVWLQCMRFVGDRDFTDLDTNFPIYIYDTWVDNHRSVYNSVIKTISAVKAEDLGDVFVFVSKYYHMDTTRRQMARVMIALPRYDARHNIREAYTGLWEIFHDLGMTRVEKRTPDDCGCSDGESRYAFPPLGIQSAEDWVQSGDENEYSCTYVPGLTYGKGKYTCSIASKTEEGKYVAIHPGSLFADEGTIPIKSSMEVKVTLDIPREIQNVAIGVRCSGPTTVSVNGGSMAKVTTPHDKFIPLDPSARMNSVQVTIASESKGTFDLNSLRVYGSIVGRTEKLYPFGYDASAKKCGGSRTTSLYMLVPGSAKNPSKATVPRNVDLDRTKLVTTMTLERYASIGTVNETIYGTSRDGNRVPFVFREKRSFSGTEYGIYEATGVHVNTVVFKRGHSHHRVKRFGVGISLTYGGRVISQFKYDIDLDRHTEATVLIEDYGSRLEYSV